MKLSSLRSIGEKREKEFHKLGIYTVEDLTRYFPRAYLDLTERTSVLNVYHNDMALVACEVTRLAPVNYASRLKIVKAYCNQDGIPFTVVWFNQPYVAQKLKPGEYLFYGRVQNKYGQVSLVNPTFEPLDKNYRLKGIIPVYSLKGNLSQKIRTDLTALMQINPILRLVELKSRTLTLLLLSLLPQRITARSQRKSRAAKSSTRISTL